MGLEIEKFLKDFHKKRLKIHSKMGSKFKEQFGLNPTIAFRDNKYYYLRFKKEDSKKLIEIVKPFIPLSMLYKVGGQINHGC